MPAIFPYLFVFTIFPSYSSRDNVTIDSVALNNSLRHLLALHEVILVKTTKSKCHQSQLSFKCIILSEPSQHQLATKRAVTAEKITDSRKRELSSDLP